MRRSRVNRRRQPKRKPISLPRLPSIPVNFRCVIVVGATAVILALSVPVIGEVLEWPVRKLEIEGDFQRVTRQGVVAAVRPGLDRSLLSLDFNDIRQRVTAMTWIDTVQLQRVWPDTLKITFREHRARARWGDGGLLNTRGELFVENAVGAYDELPQLEGPPGSHLRVIDSYLAVQEHLDQTTLSLETVRMDARGAFTIELFGGLDVRIGREDVAERIGRFFDVALPALELERQLDRAQYVDMRYPNGFVVGWRDADPERTQLARLSPDG